ncbi:hypothetical protein BGZ49_000414, partial [Haplosporangium sp. Z 27]
LVKFALDNGQPIDSALNGVLPIHAACCSNANVAVVLYLIERGADVNARRFPRKYSNEKGVQTVGTTGSTPLHFAAANGCLAVVDILLRHGAIVDLTDKYGSSPLSVAAARNHPEVASLLRQYSAMQRGVQDLTPDSEVKDVFVDRRGSLDIHRGTVTPPRSSSGQQKEANTQSTPIPTPRADRTTRVPGQRRISLPSIVESPSSPVIPAAPRQSCDFNRMPQSTEPLVRSTAFIRSTPSQPTRNIASAQTARSEDRPSKLLVREQSDWGSDATKGQSRRPMRRSHTSQVIETNVLVESKSAVAMKRRKSMESAGFLSPQSALSIHRRKSLDHLSSMTSSEAKSRRSSDASTASLGTSSSGTTRTSNTSVSEDVTDVVQDVTMSKGQDLSNMQQRDSIHQPIDSGNASGLISPLLRSSSQSTFDHLKPRRLPLSLASDSNPRQSLDLQRLASNMDRSAEKARNLEPRNDSDSDLPGLLFRRRTIQDTLDPKIGTTVPRFSSMGPAAENMNSYSSSNVEDGSISSQDLSVSRHSSGMSGTATVSSRLSRMWSSSNSGSRESLRDSSLSSSSSASNWNVSEFGEASGEAAAQNLARPNSNQSRGGMLNRLSGIWSRR